MSKCSQCGKKFHWCTSCGWDEELHPMSEGFCSQACLIAGGGRTYAEVTDESDEADEQATK